MFKTEQGIIKPITYVGLIQEGKLLLVDYKESPNPSKSGWWIPAPGLAFGEDPFEKAANLVSEMGFENQSLQLKSVESFVLPGGWHLIYHFVCLVKGQPVATENIRAFKWVNSQELALMKDIAHGKWEIGVGQSYLL